MSSMAYDVIYKLVEVLKNDFLSMEMSRGASLNSLLEDIAAITATVDKQRE